MACYKPLIAWRNPLKKEKLSFKEVSGWIEIEIACGQCIGCRLERSRQWAIRCMHEAQLHDENSFITLTFSPEALASRDNPMSLDVRDYQLFMKRLRKRFPDKKIRFFHCGEYGEKYYRPHYHACLFGLDFPDKELFKVVNGNRLYTSCILSDLWPFGFSTIGDVTFESAAYVARYIMKKVTGDDSEKHYTRIDEDTGEIYSVKPEYTTMSRRPGIASGWIEKYTSDVYPSDEVVIRGKKMRPPRFYDKYLELTRPYEFDYIKYLRSENGLKHSADNTRERLDVREKVKLSQISKLPRTVDKEN